MKHLCYDCIHWKPEIRCEHILDATMGGPIVTYCPEFASKETRESDTDDYRQMISDQRAAKGKE